MRSIELKLPDQLAEDAQRAGLLSSERLEAWLRQELKAKRIDEFFQAMERMAAVPEPAPMSPEEVAEEIAEEIAAIRAENRTSTPL